MSKYRYILTRISVSLLTIFLLVTFTFLLMHLMPGTPFSGTKALSDEIMASINAKYGLDKPILEQYFIYISNVFRGDLGISLISKRPVTEIIAQAFPVSLELGLRSMVFVLVFGLFLGIVSAIKNGPVWNTTYTLITLLGVSIPSFIVGALLQYFLSLKLYQATGIPFFPVMGWDTPASKILPAFTLAFGSIATICRLTRSSMRDVLSQDYIRTAKAKGLGTGAIVWKHCFKNAFLPILTFLGPLTAVVLTGSFVVENIFSIPGLGRYFVSSAQSYDYTVIAGTTLFFGVFLVFTNLIVDVIYGLIDPRISSLGKKGGF